VNFCDNLANWSSNCSHSESSNWRVHRSPDWYCLHPSPAFCEVSFFVSVSCATPCAGVYHFSVYVRFADSTGNVAFTPQMVSCSVQWGLVSFVRFQWILSCNTANHCLQLVSGVTRYPIISPYMWVPKDTGIPHH
jgi:hypothetical protein